jgi:hypothetical protein
MENTTLDKKNMILKIEAAIVQAAQWSGAYRESIRCMAQADKAQKEISLSRPRILQRAI